mgnify:CR=1 FL=1
MSIENITVPDLGDVSEVEVIELLVSVGQTVAENESLLVLESDKAAMEIPAPMAGVVKSIAVNLGDQVSAGSEMLALEIVNVQSDVAETEQASSAEIQGETSEEAKPKKDGPKEDGPKEDGPKEEKAEPQAAIHDVADAKSIMIEVPDLGTDDEVEVIEIHVKSGDEVAVDDALITLESDKAAMEVPSANAGAVEALLVAIGDKIRTGSPILQMLVVASDNTDGAESSTENSASIPMDSSLAEKPSAPSHAAEVIDSELQADGQGHSRSVAVNTGRVYAGPAVRKLARELGVDLSQVKGSGAKARITKDDVHDFVKRQLNAPVGLASVVPTIPDIDFSKFGEIETVPRSKLHRLTATNMHRSWSAIPHVAQFHEADITDLEEFRAALKPEAESKGVRLTFLPFLLKVCAKALIEYPQFNVSLHSSGDYLIQKKYLHIGVAVATEAGLVVPVIKNVDQKTIWQLAAEVIDMSDKAKQRKLSLEDMQGACFTISSLGAIGGTGFIPIVNAPEVAILGVAKTEIKPVYTGGEFVPRKMLPITLSYDHRAVNGVDGGLFATYLVKLLADIRHLSL